ncbi:MAG: hypothetical protein KKE98_00120 [Nanoarchaeota archaeon]|nr:hypothetical protein [Nanoarchaeota archaeon]MBU1596828.1 hypothetical protein [Nanoarchaeota archaeon]
MIYNTYESVSKWYKFKKGCSSYLKLAGDAPNIQKADEFLKQALDYMEQKNLTSGNSAYIFPTPQSNLSIWYEQIKGTKETVSELIQKGENSTQLEKDNALMKIREVVLDQGEKGTHVTLPPNITWYPKHWVMLFDWIVSILLICIGGYLIFREYY